MAFLRFRRYRVYIFAAVFFLFLVFRLSSNSQLNAHHTTIYKGYSAPPDGESSAGRGSSSSSSHDSASGNFGAGTPAQDAPPSLGSPDVSAPKVPAEKEPEKVAASAPQSMHIPQLHTSLEIKGSYGLPTGPRSQKPTAPQQTDAAASAPKEDGAFDSNRVHQVNPPATHQETAVPVVADATAKARPILSTSVIHWMKMAEHFPIPEESLILLPTGSPMPIPKIQHKFAAEPDATREIRESRLASVRGEMQHAWSGYRTYAWTHDELAPVSKGFRDPFCGWAASLVDALDTLWIMGMHDEFDEAYEAVKDIDFTTTPFRSEIPVFETIIRYLGGLIAAYDVSGGEKGKYPALLSKAVELAEILMGVFDTPNRMPILYYHWKPAFYSQPKTASSSVSVAELGSMSMEFTRLAQLTGHSKYYDAIARITDAFEDWQNRVNGTAIAGIFPEHVDASGCNRTAAAIQEAENASKLAKAQVAAANDIETEPVGYKPSQPNSDPMVAQDKVAIAKTMPPDLEFRVNSATKPGEPATGEFRKVDDVASASVGKRDVGDAVSKGAAPNDATARVAVAPDEGKTPPGSKIMAGSDVQHANKPVSAPIAANGKVAKFDCIPQNLTAGGYGMQTYSMGGSQDSTYEYFPKQYILLGGLVPKYQAMHEKVVDAVKKYLLYRPLIKDDRDILFSAKVSSRDGTDKDMTYNYEITHLTCFLGGMFAMGGRIFNRPEDVKIGGKLADGCAWAYEAMPMGIMPEGSIITPCANMTNCSWNQSTWYEKLDPNIAWRTKQMLDYEERMKTWAKESDEIKELQRARAEELERERQATLEEALANEPSSPADAVGLAPGPETPVGTANIGKRAVGGADKTPVTAADAVAINEKEKVLQGDLDLNADAAAVPKAAAPAKKPLPELVIPPMPVRPETHEEFVQNRIERDNLVPGFISMNDRRYILRPEAIESVWYMYRITGDSSWQEKGWRMFQAVIHATRTEYGHSAIADVLRDPKDEPVQVDNMESFWFAETLKYFYLLFTTPDVISLDDYVLNTEAHPFKRPT
ncbi:hypothetical protein HMPREF1624_00979 [Sporothrix schenckii ATCC 58251]|uniref:alpha-1,2-Mannosidase n=1 Tax=Sporothrix schenckii (strain ATCC 58251 / de Perez 2211183) TaxID=1391915 RepID=U7Q496_SPOS1|nr:hypothetical protein HMPREF1624_00979 [Sporothrix schenckii ATCC 58251]